MDQNFTVLIVDDEPINLLALTSILEDRYKVIATTRSHEVINLLIDQSPDILLLDVIMPDINGYTLIKMIKKIDEIKDIPIIFITSLEDIGSEERGLKLGAVDYISKPVNRTIVRARVSNHIELKHNRDLLEYKNRWLEVEIEKRVHENTILQEVTLATLVGLAETRDSDTGNHIVRTKYYCEAILNNLNDDFKKENNIDDKKISLISKAAQLHDIGKIGIPDSILLKPGRLTSDEFNIMKRHCEIGSLALEKSINSGIKKIDGSSILSHSSSLEFLEMARVISKSHHEKWDGTGYPEGLAGDDIPFAARVMALADVFDALTSKRVYKVPIDINKAITYINDQNLIHFDPVLIKSFNDCQDILIDIFNKFGDH